MTPKSYMRFVNLNMVSNMVSIMNRAVKEHTTLAASGTRQV